MAAGWSVASNNTLEQGQWKSWTPTWNTGTDAFGATNVTWNNHRWTKVGGCVYAHGHALFQANSNFGYGGTWTLWFPGEWGGYADSAGGGRIIGDGWAAGYFRGGHFQMTMVNTLNGFAVPTYVQNVGGPSQNFNAGADNRDILSTSQLYWLSNNGATPVSMYYQLRFISDPNS